MAKDAEVIDAMATWAYFDRAIRDALLAGDRPRFHQIINANFDLRARLYDVGDGNRDMIAVARETGASAKFAGSGGAIVGTYRDAEMLKRSKKPSLRRISASSSPSSRRRSIVKGR